MHDYETRRKLEILGKIDEECKNEFDKLDLGYEEEIEAFLQIIQRYIDEHPEQRDRVKEVMKKNILSNTIAGNNQKYYLPLFHDTESLMEILENPHNYVQMDIIQYNPEQCVLDKIFEQSKEAMVKYVKLHPETKEKYKAVLMQWLEEIISTSYDGNCRWSVLDCYNDTETILELLNTHELKGPMCGEILKRNKDKAVIDKILNLCFQEKNKNNADNLYLRIIRCCSDDEDVLKRVLKQCDNPEVLKALSECKLSPELRDKVIFHKNAGDGILLGWIKNLSETISENEVDKIMAKIKVGKKSISRDMWQILERVMFLNKTNKIKKKVFDFCVSKQFEGSEEYKVRTLISILEADPSEAMAQKIADYCCNPMEARRIDFGSLYNKLLEIKPTQKMLYKVFDSYTSQGQLSDSKARDFSSLLSENVLKGDENFIKFVLRQKEKMFEELPKYEEYDRECLLENLQGIEYKLKEKNYIGGILAEKYPDLCFEKALIKEAARVMKSGSEKEKKDFYDFILSEGEIHLLNDIDEKVCNYLVNNFSQENLDEVNALRSFYGLRIVIDKTDFEDKNLRTVRRMQFDDSISRTEKYTDDGEYNEYYFMQYSEAFRNFKPDRRRKFKFSDYYDVLDKSEAVKVLKDYGYGTFVDILPEALAEAKVPPELVSEFNIKDLQAFVYDADPNKDVYGWRGDYLFTKRWVELEGDIYDPDYLMGARESYWMDMVKNKKLVQVMSDDLRRHGISERDIKQLFNSAEEDGYPNFGRKRERVNSVFFQLHHVLALKDGGLNYPNNYVPVVRYPADYDGSGCRFSSHTPLHRHDTPLDEFYLVEGVTSSQDVMITRKPVTPDAKRVKIRTVFVDDDNPYKKVLYYGGARTCSRYSGRLHDMENIALKAKSLAEKQKLGDAKMKLLVQIVFQNYVNMQQKLAQRKKEKQKSQKNMKVKNRSVNKERS